jgi:hypothetical protein
MRETLAEAFGRLELLRMLGINEEYDCGNIALRAVILP